MEEENTSESRRFVVQGNGKIQFISILPEFPQISKVEQRKLSFIQEWVDFEYQRSGSLKGHVGCTCIITASQTILKLRILFLFYFLGNWGSHIRNTLTKSQGEGKEEVEANYYEIWEQGSVAGWMTWEGRNMPSKK